jgi:hypothetical protein
MQFPTVEGENLAGRRVSFPLDFAGSRTIALVAFDPKQRTDLDTWVPFIERLARTSSVRGLAFAVLSRAMVKMSVALVTAMRKAAPSPEAREVTVALFVDLEEFCVALDISDRRQIHAFVIEGDGSVGAHQVGPYDDAAGAAIEALVKEPA